MTEDMKPFIIKAAIVAGSILSVGAIFYGVSSYREYAREESHRKNQETIRQMITFCDFSKLSDDEQKSLKECGDDVEATKAQLKNILQDRITFWKSKIELCVEYIGKLEALKKNAPYWDMELERKYQDGLETIKKDGRLALNQFEAFSKKKKELDTWTPGKKNLLIEGEQKRPSTSA